MVRVDFVDLPVSRPLLDVALDLERHVAARGWDRPPALFALVPTAALAATDPTFADAPAGDLSAVEQDDLPTDLPLEELLGHLGWPAEVLGVALVVERVTLPPGAELPEDPQETERFAAEHGTPIRLVVAVARPEALPDLDGNPERAAACLVRRRDDDRDEAVALARDLAPGLIDALRTTLED